MVPYQPPSSEGVRWRESGPILQSVDVVLVVEDPHSSPREAGRASLNPRPWGPPETLLEAGDVCAKRRARSRCLPELSLPTLELLLG